MIRVIVFVAAVVLVALFLTGNFRGGPLGPSNSVSLAELFADPGRWDGKPITVTGQVSDRIAVMGFGGLRLQDQLENEILVVGVSNPEAIGQTVTVNGKFITAFAVGNITMPVILSDEK